MPPDGVGCKCGWPLDPCNPKFSDDCCGKAEYEEQLTAPPKRAKPKTVVMRLPEDVVAEVRRWATFSGCTPGEMLARAWRWYVDTHRQDIAAEYEEAARSLREGS